jgi:glucose-6-phosphate isomerase
MKKIIGNLCMLFVAAVCLNACHNKGEKSRQNEKSEEQILGEISSVHAIGKIIPAKDWAVLASPTSARIQRIMVSEGDTVHAGQLLMTLESGVSDLDVSEAQAQLRARKMPEADVARIAPHRVFSGNRPSVTIIYDKLTPFALGRLIALYEHRVFVEAQLFGINAFDQWGVELGKELATELLDVVSGKQSADGRDASTQGLIAHLRQSL